MKQTESSKRNPLTDDYIDQYCSCVEELLQNIKSKGRKTKKNDYLLDEILYDNLRDD